MRIKGLEVDHQKGLEVDHQITKYLMFCIILNAGLGMRLTMGKFH